MNQEQRDEDDGEGKVKPAPLMPVKSQKIFLRFRSGGPAGKDDSH